MDNCNSGISLFTYAINFVLFNAVVLDSTVYWVFDEKLVVYLHDMKFIVPGLDVIHTLLFSCSIVLLQSLKILKCASERAARLPIVFR